MGDASSERRAEPVPLHILLVEDNETDAFVIKDVLKRCGIDFRLRHAKDGQDAIAYLREIASDDRSACPALVLLDLNLPKLNGVEVLKRLRACRRCSGTAVIVITSSDMPSDLHAVERLGAEAYFRKPADLNAYMELTEVINRVLTCKEK